MQHTYIDSSDSVRGASLVNRKLRFRTYTHLVFKDKATPILVTNSLNTALDTMRVLNKDKFEYTIFSKENRNAH